MSSVFVEVLEVLKTSIENIDVLLNQRIARSKTFDQSRGASWRLDEELKATINSIKSYAENLAKTCIKLVLIATKKPSEVVLKSIVDELNGLCNGFVMTYFTFVSHSISDCLFDYVSKSVRVMLTYVQQLASDISVGSFENISVTAGMIDKISEETKKLPLANRLAYRRYIMERCAVLKDTVKEFDEYVAAYREKQAKAASDASSSSEVPETVFNGMNKLSVKENKNGESDGDDDDDEEEDDDDEDDFDDMDEEEVEYTPEEVQTVERCTDLMRTGYETVKLILTAVTVVSDNITATDKDTDESSEGNEQQAAELEARGMEWVASLTKLSNTIQDQSTDLGAELYPPLAENIDASVKPLATILLGTVGMAVDLLQEERFKAHQTSELIESINSIAASLPVVMNL